MTRQRRARPGVTSGTGSQISGDEPQTCRQATCGEVEIATKAYERGFCAGWRDRAEYERRTRVRTELTFDDGLKVGYELGRQDRDTW